MYLYNPEVGIHYPGIDDHAIRCMLNYQGIKTSCYISSLCKLNSCQNIKINNSESEIRALKKFSA